MRNCTCNILYNGYFLNTYDLQKQTLTKDFEKIFMKMGRLGFFFKSRVHETAVAMLLSRQLTMAAENQRLPLILSLCRGVMATLHSTDSIPLAFYVIFVRTTLLTASIDDTGISVASGPSTLGKTASTSSGFLESTLLKYFKSAISLLSYENLFLKMVQNFRNFYK